MNKDKLSCYTIAVVLIVSVFSSILLPAAGQVNNQMLDANAWQPPENFVDPVTLKIQELRAQGLNNDEITVELEKLNMGWYPETGATWIGKALTSEETAQMAKRTPFNESSKNVPIQKDATLASIGRYAYMRTNSYSWTGVSAEIVCGSMSSSSGQTLRHYLCLQMGDLDGASNWAEVVVTHNNGETYKWYTYDPDEGAWIICGDKNTPVTTADTYVIMSDGTSDSGGYHYDIWINNNWVKRGHLPNLYVQAGFQKEVYSDSGQFTNDVSNAVFYRNWLNNGQGWSYWTTNAQWSSSMPLRESHSMGAYSYNWQTWVQN